jgi:hypothetical protein
MQKKEMIFGDFNAGSFWEHHQYAQRNSGRTKGASGGPHPFLVKKNGFLEDLISSIEILYEFSAHRFSFTSIFFFFKSNSIVSSQ